MTYVHTAVVPDGAPVTISSVITLTPSYGLALWEDPDKAYPSPGVWDHATPGDQWVEGTQVSSETGDRTITMTCQLNTSGVYWQYDPYQWSQWGSWQPWGDWAWTFTKEVHLTVLPRPGSSEAVIKLFPVANPADNQEFKGEGPYGGTLYPALYVTIGAGERIKGGLTGTIVRIRDEYAGYAEGTTVNSDETVSLTTTAGWQVRSGTAWVQATVAPAETDNKNGTFPLRYRRLLGAWNTATTPTRGNGWHTLSTVLANGDDAPMEFQEWVVGEDWTHDRRNPSASPTWGAPSFGRRFPQQGRLGGLCGPSTLPSALDLCKAHADTAQTHRHEPAVAVWEPLRLIAVRGPSGTRLHWPGRSPGECAERW